MFMPSLVRPLPMVPKFEITVPLTGHKNLFLALLPAPAAWRCFLGCRLVGGCFRVAQIAWQDQFLADGKGVGFTKFINAAERAQVNVIFFRDTVKRVAFGNGMIPCPRHPKHAPDGKRVRRGQAVSFNKVADRHVISARNAVKRVAFADRNIVGMRIE